MKKLLALVLALVMTLSLAVVSSNAAFKDADKVNETYAEAVEVLNGMKVFKGYEDGSFNPEGAITRAEVAAIVYRLYTGDVKDAQASLYATYNKFNDMSGAKWAAGYIGYCANAGLIKGYNDTTFGPSDKVTGYQALAMILRAVGYDKNGEFTGAGWQLHVAQYAQQLGVLTNVKGVDLNAAASRQLVAELLFQVAAYVPMVTYTPAFGYQSVSLTGGNAMFAANATLGYKNFGLTCDKTYGSDAWGRPAYVWYGEYNNAKNYQEKSKDVIYATIKATPDATYQKAVAQCDVAKDAGLTAKVTSFDVYYNSGVKTGTQDIESLATAKKIGAQGQQVEVYVAAKRIVIVDTFLAYVKSVKEATYDKNGHLASEAKIVLNIFDGTTTNDTKVRSLAGVAKDVTKEYVLTNGSENYTYAAGDMVLVNAYTDKNAVATKDFWKNGTYAEIIGKADSVEGTQTQIWYAAFQHTVNGTTYDDAVRFNLDEANKNTTTYTWYFDQFGNLIGNTEVATNYSYAAVKSIWCNTNNGSSTVYATLVYMDGQENTVAVSGIKIYESTANGADKLSATLTPLFSGYYGQQAMQIIDNKYLTVAQDAKVNALADKKDIIVKNLFAVSAAANDTYVLEEVTTELTGAKIIAKYAQVNGKANKAGTVAAISTNADTQYLLYNTTTEKFEAISGYNSIYDFQNNTVVADYVLASTGYAKYVYLYGTPDQTTTRNFVLVQNPNRSAMLKDNEVEYYVVTFANINGEVTTLKVKNDQNGLKILDDLTKTANLNKLYYVTFTGEYATGLVEITTTSMAAPTLPGLAANVRASKLVDADNNTVTLIGTDLAWGIYHFNVTEATEVVGTLTPNARQTGKIVYVISNNTDNVAEKVYVVDNAAYKPGSETYPNTIKSANVAALTAPVANGVVTKEIVFDDVTNTFTSSTGKAMADGAVLKASIQWQYYVIEGGEGKWVDYNADRFAPEARVYQAIVTVEVDNSKTTTYPYVLASDFAVSYKGTAQASNGFTVSTF